MGDFIQKFWDNQAHQFNQLPDASWQDKYMMELEIQNLLKYIPRESCVIDVGCANGYSTEKILQLNPKRIVGIDFSKQMIAFAEERFKDTSIKDGTITLHTGDIRDIQYDNEEFDSAYCIRVLINLPNWEDQMKGINEMLRIVKKGGIVILSEAFFNSFIKLNTLRTVSGLPPLVEHDFNRYLKEDKLEEFLNSCGYEWHVDKISSTYYLGTRFIKELVMQESDSARSLYYSHQGYINDVFFELQNKIPGGDFGIQKQYIIRK